jgi:hypothetical protein
MDGSMEEAINKQLKFRGSTQDKWGFVQFREDSNS